MRKYWLAVFLILAALLTAAPLWLWLELHDPFPANRSAETLVDIPQGAGVPAIAAALQSGGVLRRQLPFLLYVRWKGIGRLLQAGEYRFTSPTTPVQVATRLVQGDVYYRTLTIPEGFTAQEIVSLMAANGFGAPETMKALIARADWISDLAPGAHSLEGYLFPDTYRFSSRTTPDQLIKGMIAQFREHMKALVAENPLPPGWRVADIVVLASLIEKEARTPEERRLVASVMINRLRLKIPLACDPTIIYALKQSGGFDGNLRKSHLSLQSPYNSYLHAGLPPGPIANPGADALRSALSPAESDYLYYVSRNDGTHVFSRDLQSHNLAVDRFQRRRQNR